MPDGERTSIVATDRPAMGTSPGLPGVASLTSDRLKAVSPTAATTAQQRPKPREVTHSCPSGQQRAHMTTADRGGSPKRRPCCVIACMTANQADLRDLTLTVIARPACRLVTSVRK